MANVTWPPADGDLSVPIQGLLKNLELLERREQGPGETKSPTVTLVGGTPASLQVITSGATSLAKWMALALGTVGGGSGAWAAVKGFWLNEDETLRLAYTGAAALILSAVAVSIAIIVRGDVTARASAMAAEYAARSQVAAAMLTTPNYGRVAPALAPAYFAAVPDGANPPNQTWKPVEAFSRNNGTWTVKIDGRWEDVNRVIDLITYEELLRAQAKAATNGKP
ncbi:hypothetical protein [Motilibacter aurantiacus]|uniref:hypothetical protein n=1 Tax=Motilibacter aurantiacus TaxID=2714955 RepID=UPI001408B7D6|nr:hypothetical protein [Motilibacter aurantiacus]NHC43681.1 hypothetical protein [Motilibacter aurantiacus]